MVLGSRPRTLLVGMRMHGSGTKLAMFLDFNIRLAYAIGLRAKDKALE